jgi:hypothetical protein
MQLNGCSCAAELRLLSERRGVEWPSVRGKNQSLFSREIRRRNWTRLENADDDWEEGSNSKKGPRITF